MRVLGIHGHPRLLRPADAHWLSEPAFHDAAAVILDGPDVVAAVEEERSARVRHANFFPSEAIRSCLDIAGWTIGDVDRIALSVDPATLREDFARSAFRENGPPIPVHLARACAHYLAHSHGLGPPEMVFPRLRFHNHHVAHAAGVCGVAGFDQALVVVLDGVGDGRSGAAYRYEGNALHLLRDYTIDESLGNFYLRGCRALGFELFEEYKVMGLAPYGDVARFARLFDRVCQLLPDGYYELPTVERWLELVEEARHLGYARRARGEPILQVHRDFAAALQDALERVVLHVLGGLREITSLTNLCVSGGVAQNCSANGRVLRSGLFDRVFVQPACHDAGNALGAAIATMAAEAPAIRPHTLRSMALGRHLADESAIERELSAWASFVRWRRLNDVAGDVGALIAADTVLGWVQGRAEFGPRALGNRSILADPRPLSNRKRINEMIKRREGFRPFAPAVTHECAHTYFEFSATQATLDFMTHVVAVRPEHRTLLGAVTHIDGTARVQTVRLENNPLFHALLDAFGQLTGVPILLNTSFNNHVEPIVDNVRDAIVCFLTTGLDMLVLGSYLVQKVEPCLDAWLSMSIDLPPHRNLTRRRTTEGAIWEITARCSEAFGQRTVTISDATARILARADGQASLEALASSAGVDPAPCLSELHSLWSDRAVQLLPCIPGPRQGCP